MLCLIPSRAERRTLTNDDSGSGLPHVRGRTSAHFNATSADDSLIVRHAARSLGHTLPGPAVARVFPNIGGILQPALCVFFFVQGLIEHYADALPTLAVAGPSLVPLALALVVGFFYYAYKASTHPKMVLAGLVAYVVVVVVAKGGELGFPKDTAAEQIAALKDPVYTQYHLIVHVVFNLLFCAVSYSAPSVSLKSIHAKKA